MHALPVVQHGPVLFPPQVWQVPPLHASVAVLHVLFGQQLLFLVPQTVHVPRMQASPVGHGVAPAQQGWPVVPQPMQLPLLQRVIGPPHESLGA